MGQNSMQISGVSGSILDATQQSNHTVTFNEWTWSAKLTYQLDADKMLYFAYDKGFKSGGVNRGFGACGLIPGAPCLRPDQALWEPETTFNYEIGMKSEWLDNTLRLNVTLFHQIYEDFQVTENVLSETNVVVTNAAEVTSNGLEGEVLWAANDILTLNANFTLAETEYDKFENSPCASGSQPGCVNGVIDLSGKRLNNAPEVSINLGAELRDQFEPINGSEWFVRLDASYRSDQNLSVSLPESTEQSGYGLLNGRFGINVYDSWQLTIWGKNLLDKEYVDYAETGDTGIAKIPGLPRTYGLTVDWHL